MVRYDGIDPDTFRIFVKGMISTSASDWTIFEFDYDRITVRCIDSSKACMSKSILESISEDFKRKVIVSSNIEILKRVASVFTDTITIEFDEERNILTIKSGKFTFESKNFYLSGDESKYIHKVDSGFEYATNNVIASDELKKKDIKLLLEYKADNVIVEAIGDKIKISTEKDLKIVRSIEVNAKVTKEVKAVYRFDYVSKILDKEFDGLRVSILENKFLYCSLTTSKLKLQFVVANVEIDIEKYMEEKKEVKVEEEKIIEKIEVKINKDTYDVLRYINNEFSEKFLLLSAGDVYVIGRLSSDCNLYKTGFVYSVFKLDAYRGLYDSAEFTFYKTIRDIIHLHKGIRKDEIYKTTILRIKNKEETICVEEPHPYGDFKSKESLTDVINALKKFGSIELGEIDNLDQIVKGEFFLERTDRGVRFRSSENIKLDIEFKHLYLYDKLSFCVQKYFKLPKGIPAVRVNENLEKPILVFEYKNGLNIMFTSTEKIVAETRKESEVIKEKKIEDKKEIVFKVIEEINVNKNREATMREIYDGCSRKFIDKTTCATALSELEKEKRIYKLPLGYVTSEFYYEYYYNKLIKKLLGEGISIDDVKTSGINVENEFNNIFEKFKDFPSTLEEQIDVLASDIVNRIRSKRAVDVEIVELRKIVKKAVDDSKKLSLQEAYKLLKQYSDKAKELFDKTTASDLESRIVLFEYKARTLPLATLFKDKELEWVRNIQSPI